MATGIEIAEGRPGLVQGDIHGSGLGTVIITNDQDG